MRGHAVEAHIACGREIWLCFGGMNCPFKPWACWREPCLQSLQCLLKIGSALWLQVRVVRVELKVCLSIMFQGSWGTAGKDPSLDKIYAWWNRTCYRFLETDISTGHWHIFSSLLPVMGGWPGHVEFNTLFGGGGRLMYAHDWTT